MMLGGAVLLLYPTVSDYMNHVRQSRAIAGYTRSANAIGTDREESMWESAEAYNRQLANIYGDHVGAGLSPDSTSSYETTLDTSGTGMIGIIRIPKIHVELPFYHGVGEEVLQVAAGHLPSSSFPTGKAGTHCILLGHTGLPSAKLFTDLERMEEGDRFSIFVLRREFVYEVDQIRVVLPRELADLTIDPNRSLCTLVTCTPYGSNTHRLLVRGHQIDAIDEAKNDMVDIRNLNGYPAPGNMDRFTAGVVVILCCLMAGSGVCVVFSIVRRTAQK